MEDSGPRPPALTPVPPYVEPPRRRDRDRAPDEVPPLPVLGPPPVLRPMATDAPDRSMQTRPDGTRVEYRADGTPVRQWNRDGSVVTYDAAGQPVTHDAPHGPAPDPAASMATTAPASAIAPASATAPASAGASAPAASTAPVAAAGSQPGRGLGRLLRRRTTAPVERSADRPSERGSDGSRELGPPAFDSFDGRGRPLTGTLGDGRRVRYQYGRDDAVRVRYTSGRTRAQDALSRLGFETLSDGTRYTSFDRSGRPVAGTAPDGSAIVLDYGPRGEATERPARDGELSRFAPPGGLDPGSGANLEPDPRRAGSDPTTRADADPRRAGSDRNARGEADPEEERRRSERGLPNPGSMPQQLSEGPTEGASSLPGSLRSGLPGVGTEPELGPGAGLGSTSVTAGQRGIRTATVGGDDLPTGPAIARTGPGAATAVAAEPGLAGLPTGRVLPGGSSASFTDVAAREQPLGVPPGLAAIPPGLGALPPMIPDDRILAADPNSSIVDSSGIGAGLVPAQSAAFGAAPDPVTDAVTGPGTTTAVQDVTLPDGSVVEVDGNGQVIRTWTPDGSMIDWSVDLPALQAAINTVAGERETIRGDMESLKAQFRNLEGYWDSPAGMSLHPVVDNFTLVADSFVAVLDDALSRMRNAYSMYVDAESTNTANLS